MCFVNLNYKMRLKSDQVYCKNITAEGKVTAHLKTTTKESRYHTLDKIIRTVAEDPDEGQAL